MPDRARHLADVFSRLQGAYTWGERDCLALARDVAVFYCPDQLNALQQMAAQYHAVTEAEAMATILEQASGVFVAVVRALSALDLRDRFTLHEWTPVEPFTTYPRELFTPGTLVELPKGYGGEGRIGVVGDDCLIWSWHTWRLGPLAFDPFTVREPVRFLVWHYEHLSAPVDKLDRRYESEP